MKDNPLKKLETFGQSIWLDYIRRDLISGGELQRLIDDDGLRGITSNPAIFEKAIAESDIYDDDIKEMAAKKKNVKEIYEALSQRDVQNAADKFKPVYEKTNGCDGYVSLEVNPHLAHDTQGTIEEARRLWAALDRPNVFIKVPATTEGLPAIRQLIGEGINVNVTLLFGLSRYAQVVQAYIDGLQARACVDKPINSVVSVASFFLSRIDTLLDPQIEKSFAPGGKAQIAKKVHGQVAIASAKLAYQAYKDIFAKAEFKKLIAKGARAQRLLWASTSTKNPTYSDIRYIEELIGPDTVNTVPRETIDAYLDHGKPRLSLEDNIAEANRIMAQLPEIKIDINKVAQQLEDEGVKKFNEPFDKLMAAITKKSVD